ncbi:MAG: PQQ-like beta-propeller repeat protein [Clostridia bacterium]|nr:PQQ-like beta-propeller repeat protein [Clostridia bacterium]
MKRMLVLLTLMLLLAVPALAEQQPHLTPTPIPEPVRTADEAEALSAVDYFFWLWKLGNTQSMLEATAPSWRAAQQDPLAALIAICDGYTPTGFPELYAASDPSDVPIRTIGAKVSMRIDGSSAEQPYVFTVIVMKEDGEWYVDPQSVAITKPSATPTPAPEPVDVYVDGVLTEGYQREEPIDMPAGEDYTAADSAVSTWRGDNYRTNAAASSMAEAPAQLQQVWSLALNASDMLFSEDMQPTIVKWPREIREVLLINQSARDTIALKEVYIPTLDGRILCLRLSDGASTRSAIRVGYPITGSVTVHPVSYPMLIAGQASGKRAYGLGHMGLRYISAIDGVTDRFVADQVSSSFTTSALIDKNTNTAVFLSSSGWLFTEKLNAWLTADSTGAFDSFRFYTPQSVSARVSEATVTAAPVMSDSLLWLGNNAGQVICVDTTTMQPLWTAEGLHFVSSLAMRETEDGQQLLAVTGLGAAHLYVLDPDTGSVAADIPLTLSTPGPCTASAPVVGQEGLDGLVFVNLTGTSDNTSGLAELCAIDMETGMISWRVGYPDSAALSAPVAVYDDAGNGFLVTAMEGEEDATLLLLEGRTGVIIATLTLEGNAPCSPAVYGSMLVITTNTEDGGKVYGVRLAPGNPASPHPDNKEALVEAFMTAWADADIGAMQALCAPTWVAAQENASVMLFMYCANRTPTGWEYAPSADGDSLQVCLDRHDGRTPEWYAGAITITEEDGQLWIDPQFIFGLATEQ